MMRAVMLRHLSAFLLGVQFLTTLPVPRNIASDNEISALSLLWYPAVGLLLGIILTVFCPLLPLPFFLQAALTVVLWIVLTGGLHLDGLADCADAWVGGLGNREKTLLLLKDPLCGSMGVLALIALVLLKVTLVAAVLQAGTVHWLWLVPFMARLSLLSLFYATPYVRPEGLGAILAEYFSPLLARRVLLGLALVTYLLLPLVVWAAVWASMLGICLLARWITLRRLGGFTGDVAGAQVELVELGMLLVLVLVGAG